MLTSYGLYSNHPQIMVYLRKTENQNLPYAVAEFRFTLLTFVYIIPKASCDKVDFTNESNYDYFWNFFKHYKSDKNWNFVKMDDVVSRIFVMNLNFEEKNKL